MYSNRRYAGAGGRTYAETDPSGRYGRFEETLGRGSMKTVYRAFDELQGMEVAWNQAKICDVLRSPEALERLYSEVHILSTINHESVIQFYSSWVDTDKRTFNFITEMFTSGTLREYRQRYRHVDRWAVKNWARQILRGLVYLHNHDPPVIHRDLKCDNIFINGHLGQVKIGDLGLAAVLRGSHHAHTVIGTPEFMAPELYDEEYNELVDVYSFGMCVLEMLTGEYPYSECFNPAQIYKKVTSGKLPGALVRVQDQEAQRFIRRCLEGASRRSSAADLLIDPFLQLNPHQMAVRGGSHSSTSTMPMASSNHPAVHQGFSVNANMKITGKKNPDDNTIFLTVQMVDNDGHERNIYFPFDMLNDTPTDVADEMVKELEITDHDSSEIARMIDQEVSTLVPHWRGERPVHNHNQHVFSYIDHDHYLSSPTSSQASTSSLVPSKPNGSPYRAEIYSDGDDSDTASQISLYHGNFSYANYNSGGEQGSESSPLRSESLSSPQSQQPSRLCQEEITRDGSSVADKLQKKCSLSGERPMDSTTSISGKMSSKKQQLVRNRSLIDMRSQLLHRSLMDQVKKRLSKTVGSVESIGYHNPCETSSKDKRTSGVSKKWGFARGRG